MLLDEIGANSTSVVMDTCPTEQVWNYPAYKYSMKYDPDIGDPSKTHVTCMVWFADDDVDPSFLLLKQILRNTGFTRNVDEHIKIFRDKLSDIDEIIPKEDYVFVLKELISQFLDPLGNTDGRIKNLPGAISDAIRNDDYSIHIENLKKRQDEFFIKAKTQESKKQAEDVKREQEAIELTELYEEVRSNLMDIKQQLKDDEYVKASWGKFGKKINNPADQILLSCYMQYTERLHERGRSANDICRELGISQATFYNWKVTLRCSAS